MLFILGRYMKSQNSCREGGSLIMIKKFRVDINDLQTQVSMPLQFCPCLRIVMRTCLPSLTLYASCSQGQYSAESASLPYNFSYCF